MSSTPEQVCLLPRLIRLRDAPHYLGMDRHRFNAEVRPFVTEIPIGIQGIAFDRLELDAWVAEYVRRAGRSRRITSWGTHERSQVSPSKAGSGTSTNGSKAMEGFARVLEQIDG